MFFKKDATATNTKWNMSNCLNMVRMFFYTLHCNDWKNPPFSVVGNIGIVGIRNEIKECHYSEKLLSHDKKRFAFWRIETKSKRKISLFEAEVIEHFRILFVKSKKLWSSNNQ